jgi:hypothetical protein
MNESFHGVHMVLNARKMGLQARLCCFGQEGIRERFLEFSMFVVLVIAVTQVVADQKSLRIANVIVHVFVQIGFDKNRKYDFKRAYFHGFRPRFWQTNGTQIYKGYITELIQTLEEGGFFPRQCRVWKFPPGHRIGEHSDASENMYAVRLHIPIVTNPKAIHRWYYDGKMIEDHMEADGSAYLIRTNVWHDAGNFGDEDRYHFVCEAWDTRHTTPGFGYDNIQRVIDRAQKRVDDTEKFLKANPDWVADSWRGDKAHGTKTV